MGVVLCSPTNGRPLVPRGPQLLSDGERLWPVVEGIAYLRTKEELRRAVVEALQADREGQALRLLLADQDRFSPTSPPDTAALNTLLGAGQELTLRRAMALLNFGPVADYFTYRWSSPTFVGGLRLLELSVPNRGGRVVEYACGIGHFLRELESMGVRTVGVDIVWAKLWLARRFMGVTGTLICGDVETGTVVGPAERCTVLCHDALYFFEHKQSALDNMRRVAAGGRVAVGHVHTRLDQHRVGFAETLAVYRQLTPGTIEDDRSYGTAWFTAGLPTAATQHSSAVAWMEGDPLPTAEQLHFGPALSDLQQNPLLALGEVRWPTRGWQREYQEDAAHIGPYALTDLVADPLVQQLTTGSRQVGDLCEQERLSLYRRQALLNLPPRW
ncbi:class I SAM-dependent methyltransferase [Neolewinella sp.]|uniref:class I SAM-dependent methyltransferase n=1 Tax=Neolewinella sp. TaxID=2993543 RepID=UPI003B517261